MLAFVLVASVRAADGRPSRPRGRDAAQPSARWLTARLPLTRRPRWRAARQRRTPMARRSATAPCRRPARRRPRDGRPPGRRSPVGRGPTRPQGRRRLRSATAREPPRARDGDGRPGRPSHARRRPVAHGRCTRPVDATTAAAPPVPAARAVTASRRRGRLPVTRDPSGHGRRATSDARPRQRPRPATAARRLARAATAGTPHGERSRRAADPTASASRRGATTRRAAHGGGAPRGDGYDGATDGHGNDDWPRRPAAPPAGATTAATPVATHRLGARPDAGRRRMTSADELTSGYGGVVRPVTSGRRSARDRGELGLDGDLGRVRRPG